MKLENLLLEEDKIELAKSFIEKAKEKGVNLYLPIDVVVADEFSKDADTKVVEIDQIPADWMGLDIGPKTAELVCRSHSKFEINYLEWTDGCI